VEVLCRENEAAIREDPTKFDRNVLNAWRQIHDAQRKQVTEDPVTFAMRQGSIPVPFPVDLSDPEPAADALTDRFGIARAVSARYNAPFKPLTREEVAVMSSALSHGSPEMKRDYLAKLARATSRDPDGYMALMGQIAPDDPVTAIAGAMAGRQENRAADLMLRGQAILRPPAKGDGRPDSGGLLPMPSETELRSDFDSTVRDALTASPKARSAHYQAAKAIYAAMSADAGDKDTKTLDRDRWEDAITMAVGQIEKYNGRRMVLPRGYDVDQFEDRIDEVVQSITKGSQEAQVRLGETTRLRESEVKRLKASGKLLEPGNIEQERQRLFRLPGGDYSTTLLHSMNVDIDGKEVLLPTVDEQGRQMSEQEAIDRYRQTGEHLGKFRTPEAAAAFGQMLSQTQAARIPIFERNLYLLNPAWTADRLLDLPLENIGDNRYVFRSGDGAVSDIFGRAVILDLSGPQPAPRAPQSSPYVDALMGVGGTDAP